MKKGVERFSDDAVLLKLHRLYGKDEALGYLFDEISKLRFQIGELKSENAELQHQNRIVKGVRQWSKDEYVLELKKNISAKQETNSRVSKEMVKWRNMYFDLLLKVEPTAQVSDTTKLSNEPNHD